MHADEVMQLFERVGAVRHGHFELSSGRHSSTYVQCALVLQYPESAEKLGRALAEKFKGVQIDCVASPALGGVLVGHEVARGLGVRAVFVERDISGRMALRRGFAFQPNERVLVVEDVWTTGGSTRETIAVVEQAGGLAVAAGALIDRSGNQLELNVPTKALIDLDIPSYEAFECPLCRSGQEIAKPGSHFVRSEK
ncbi:MAG TPA: orotate phosphoribosyltransferase [Candidatus Acidoferrales bacterium]|jgi:orotate phosphoribosyltransferase|nr:orotate phosphoribosyltransferase [Candidatus Acidoferrales bacterium]